MWYFADFNILIRKIILSKFQFQPQSVLNLFVFFLAISASVFLLSLFLLKKKCICCGRWPLYKRSFVDAPYMVWLTAAEPQFSPDEKSNGRVKLKTVVNTCFLLISRKLAAVLLKIKVLKNPRWRPRWWTCCKTAIAIVNALIKTWLLLWKIISDPKAAYIPMLDLLCATFGKSWRGGGGGGEWPLPPLS